MINNKTKKLELEYPRVRGLLLNLRRNSNSLQKTINRELISNYLGYGSTFSTEICLAIKIDPYGETCDLIEDDKL